MITVIRLNDIRSNPLVILFEVSNRLLASPNDLFS